MKDLMPRRALAIVLLFAAAGAWAQPAATPAASIQAQSLQMPEAFETIKNKDERSRALFVEAGKAIMSPRCMNCHPKDESPTQGENMHTHVPRVVRGADGHGATALQCSTCHQAENFAPSGVPGDPMWHLAPASMAWQGKTLGQICTQIKDTRRNGGKTLAQIQEHMATDHLVGWGWKPGGNRVPAPGTQEQFGALIQAWIDTGAACPSS